MKSTRCEVGSTKRSEVQGTKFEVVGGTKYFGEYGGRLYIIGAYLWGVARIYSPPKNAARTGESDAGRELNQLSITFCGDGRRVLPVQGDSACS